MNIITKKKGKTNIKKIKVDVNFNVILHFF